MSEDPNEISRILTFQRSLLQLAGRRELPGPNAAPQQPSGKHARQLDQFVRKVRAKVS